MNRFFLYPGDFLADTADLSSDEVGIYIRLICVYYRTEAPISNQNRFRIASALTPKEKQNTDCVLARFFERNGDDWFHDRIEREIEKAQVKTATSRANGRKGGRPRKTQTVFSEQTQEKPSGLQNKPNGFLVDNPDEKPPKPKPKPSSSKEEQHRQNPLGLSERAGRALHDPSMARFNPDGPPHLWPEVRDFADVLWSGLGFQGSAKLGPVGSDNGVRRILELMEAGITLDELREAAPRLPQHEFTGRVKKLHAVTVGVIRELLPGALQQAAGGETWDVD